MFGRLLGRLLLMPASRETQKAVEKEFRALEPLLLSRLSLTYRCKKQRYRYSCMRDDRNSYAKRSKKELKGGRKSEILHLHTKR